MGEPEKALNAWKECLARGKGEEVSAAAVALAEAHLKTKTPEEALPALVRGLENINVPADWKNSLVTLAKAARLPGEDRRRPTAKPAPPSSNWRFKR